jgi:class 3 adenylate cyclase
LGLFELRWELMCPTCQVAKAEAQGLAELPMRFHCDTCGIDYDADFDQRVELRFSVHDSVRHAENSVFCIGGPWRMPHVVAQQYLNPQENRALGLQLESPLKLRAVGSTSHANLLPDPQERRSSDVSLIYSDGRWVGPHSMAASEELLAIPSEASLSLRNQTGGPILAVLEDIGWSGDATTASQVTSMQEFRDLFSSEVLAPGQELAVRDITVLFSDLQGSTALYETVGDAVAYGRVNRHFDFVRETITRNQGTTVKTMGDGLMGGFYKLEDGLRAAISLQRDIDEWCRSMSIDPPLRLKIGLHHGPVIAMTANDRLDYFGRAVNVAARLGAQGRGGDIVLLADTYQEIEAVASNESATVERFTAHLRGLAGELDLVRLQIS